MEQSISGVAVIFRYPGGKRRLAKQIISKFPSYDEYREPFCGGGSVFFNIPSDKKRWINDLDVDLMSVYLALRDRPKEFIDLCRVIKPHQQGEELTSAKDGGRKLYNKRLKAAFDYFSYNKECDQALRYFFVNRTVFAGRVVYDIPSRMYFSNPSGWNIVKTDKLEKAAEILKDVKITTDDYKEVIEKDGDNVVIYIDPPYVVNTKLARTSQLYKHSFTLDDHLLLRDILLSCKHNLVISYDDDKDGLIRELYKDFNISEFNHTYCGTTCKKKKSGKELLITNF